MKQILTLFIAVLFAISANAQTTYETSRDSLGNKVLKGPITRDILQKDTAFAWFGSSLKAYVPIPAAVTTLQQNGPKVSFVVFGGTWCEDTHFLLPRFFGWLQAAGYDASSVQLIGVDRKKKSTDNSTDTYHIVSVPTFIVLKEGKEIGRMVEYGKYAQPDKELAELIETAK